jgi:hypothetical protein
MVAFFLYYGFVDYRSISGLAIPHRLIEHRYCIVLPIKKLEEIYYWARHVER